VILRVNELEVRYGAGVALKDLSLSMEEGGFLCLLGANGAGKSTTVRAISGLIPVFAGSIEYLGKRIDGMRPEKIARLGVTIVPEGRQIFGGLTVKENLRMGAVSRNNKQEVIENMEMVFNLFPVLKDRLKQHAGTLSGGEQQMLAVARGLMAHPKLLVLDEPSLGLAPLVIKHIFEALVDIHQQNVSIFLVEQNMRMALKFASYGYILELGKIVIEGPTSELVENEKIQKAFLSYEL
jgi:branched-chain amino acid transport system ATP-binding protein